MPVRARTKTRLERVSSRPLPLPRAGLGLTFERLLADVEGAAQQAPLAIEEVNDQRDSSDVSLISRVAGLNADDVSRVLRARRIAHETPLPTKIRSTPK